MTRRLVSVDDDFNVPDKVNVRDMNLPDRLQDTALNATYLDKESAAATYALKSEVPPANLDGGNAAATFTGTFNFDGGSAA